MALNSNSTQTAAASKPTPTHGERELERVSITSYSLELEDAQGLVGDQASETAFRKVLKAWQLTLERAGRDPFGASPPDQMSKEELDRIASSGGTEAARMVALAINDFSARLAYVIGRFMRHPGWAGVERIVVGGGFKESAIGKLAIYRTQRALTGQGITVELRPIHHGADDGGLVGWLPMSPRGPDGHAFLAVDIGGTNVRCGIVQPQLGGDPVDARVLHSEKWRHADSKVPQNDLVEGIVEMLRRLIDHAAAHRIPLLPFVGIACPGVIRSDGSIDRGAQNLPGDWYRASFHLPSRIRENIPRISDADTLVLMHNDAVVQGLSELPCTLDVKRWAVLTIGTGLGNASFTNRSR
jgi:hypothetical protein